MPRYRRLFVKDIPLHIVQRGHDRKAVFVQPEDYQYYLANLVEMKDELAIDVYAYCLMTNHVHLLIMPRQVANNVSKLVRLLAARQTRHVNKLERRTGTLWEGRFKASLIDSDGYLLACHRYVDLNPVRAAMVTTPEDYEWSSYRSHAGLYDSDILDEHDTFQRLGDTRVNRAVAYRKFVAQGVSDSELRCIRSAIQRNQLTGNNGFEDQIAKRTGRRILTRGQGRPPARK